MTLQLHARAAAAAQAEPESDTEQERPIVENVIALTGTTLAMLFMLSVAVVMYWA